MTTEVATPNWGKHIVPVILGFIGLFSFFVPVIYSALLLFRLIDTSDWTDKGHSSALIGIYIIFWFASVFCLTIVFEIYRPKKQDKKEDDSSQ